MKDLNISKELIKNVLVEETENLSDDFTFNIKDNYILFVDEGECQFEVNIYEFAFKCKEWAYKNSKVNMITVDLDKDSEDYYDVSVLWGECFDDYVMYYFKDKNEIVAIVKACNWILEQQK